MLVVETCLLFGVEVYLLLIHTCFAILTKMPQWGCHGSPSHYVGRISFTGIERAQIYRLSTVDHSSECHIQSVYGSNDSLASIGAKVSRR